MSESRTTVHSQVFMWGPVEVSTSEPLPGTYTVKLGTLTIYMNLAQLQSFAVQVAAIAQAHAEDAEDAEHAEDAEVAS